MHISEHRLHLDAPAEVTHLDTPNQGGTIQPRYLVVHYTAGPSAERAAQTLMRRTRKASAHLIIGEAGEIFQLAGFDRRAWHAGRSRWKGLSGLNEYSIGIELSNPGRLRRTRAGYQTEYGAAVADHLVHEAAHRNGGASFGWHVYSESQLDTLEEVTEVLMATYDLEAVLGHDDVAPGRKLDPGPAFPMRRFRQLFSQRDSEGDVDLPYDPWQLFVTSRELNIRAEPSTQGAKLSAPLARQTQVAVLEEHGLWRRVDVLTDGAEESALEGWVFGRFLEPA